MNLMHRELGVLVTNSEADAWLDMGRAPTGGKAHTTSACVEEIEPEDANPENNCSQIEELVQ